jgi:ATP-dependent DNA helicase RecG
MFNEDQYIEFKPNFNSDVIETLVAFANTEGVFKDIEWIERYGTGIRKIKDYFLNYGSPEPIFENFQHGFRVIAYTLQRRTAENVTDNVTENVTENRDNLILDLIRSDNKISTDKLAKQLKVTRMTIYRDLDKLKSRGIIERVGADKGGYWKIMK